MATSIKWNGKEVQNPFLRILAAVVIITAVVGILLLVMTFLPVLLLVLLGVVVLMLPLHFLLIALGYRGFYVYENHTHTWTTTGAFKRR